MFKKGDRSMPSSYRPISVILVLGKLFEAVMKKQLMHFFESMDYYFSKLNVDLGLVSVVGLLLQPSLILLLQSHKLLKTSLCTALSM